MQLPGIVSFCWDAEAIRRALKSPARKRATDATGLRAGNGNLASCRLLACVRYEKQTYYA